MRTSAPNFSQPMQRSSDEGTISILQRPFPSSISSTGGLSNMSAPKKKKSTINKLTRYKIALAFYLLYLATSIGILLIVKRYPKIKNSNPFSEMYIILSFLILFIGVYFFLHKFASKKAYNYVNLLKYYVPDWKKDMSHNDFKNLNSNFYIMEGTEEKFNKNVHYISFILMLLIYFSFSFLYLSYSIPVSEKENTFFSSISLPLASIAVIIVLRKIFLNTQSFDVLSTISLIILLGGVVFLFLFEFKIVRTSKDFSWIYGYNSLSGICFGLFSVCLKYCYNIYGNNFKISLIFGYMGLYNLLSIPLVLCTICILGEENITLFENTESYFILFLTRLLTLCKLLTSVHCIIGLSPLVFSMGMFMDVLINLTMNIFSGNCKADHYYYASGSLIVIGICLGGLDKYLKNKIKDRIKKEQEEIGEEKKE